jgi:hypothetical protein
MIDPAFDYFFFLIFGMSAAVWGFVMIIQMINRS